jgi:hypothetical protein
MDCQAHPPVNGEFRPPNLPDADTGFVRLDPTVLPSGAGTRIPSGCPPRTLADSAVAERKTKPLAGHQLEAGADFRESAMNATAGNLMSSRTTSGSDMPGRALVAALAPASRLARMAPGLAVRLALTFAPRIPARVRAGTVPRCARSTAWTTRASDTCWLDDKYVVASYP